MTLTSIGPYRIIELLGSGGMGEVYLAEDSRLGRLVALKTLTPDPAQPDAVERLMREARAAATLSDPSIAAVYDVFEHGGRAWLVMEYVDGETLAARLGSGPLPIGEAIDLTLQLLQGLAEAHRRGVVHRDLKPSNLMITPAGRLKILDFGIARVPASPQEVTRTEGLPTSQHEIVGSPGYIAPERLLGRSFDGRADIYSVGVLLFEMLTGRRPIEAPDFMSAALRALTESAPSARDVNASVPIALSAVVARAIAREPTDRFQSAAEFREALVRAQAEPSDPAATASGAVVARQPPRVRLQWMVGLTMLVLVGIVAAVAWWLFSPGPAPAPPPETPVVAILPFENLTGDPGSEYLGVGFAQSLVTDLSALQEVTVVTLAAVRDFGGNTRERSTVMRNLGATRLVDGSIQRAGNRLRINVGLLESDASLVWSQAYEGTIDELFDLQRRLADGVIRAVGPEAGATAVARTGDTTDVVALASYWQGRAFLERPDVPGNAERAVAAFESAVKRDPSYTAARAALGEAAWLRYRETRDRTWADRALAETEAAVQQDPAHAPAHVSLALVYEGTGRVAEAIEALGRAIQLQPNNDDAHQLLGETLANSGRTEEGIAALQKAIDLRPRFARHHARLGVVYHNVGRVDEAIAELRTATELQPDNPRNFHVLGAFLQTRGDTREALESYGRAIELAPLPETFGNIGVIHYEAERYEDAARSFEEAVRLRPNEPRNHRNLGDAYQRLAQPEKARGAYQRAVDLAEESLRVSPGDARMLSLLALCLAKLGRPDDAERHAAEAVRLNAASAEAWYRQAAVYALAGRQAEALSSLERALAHGYSPTRVGRDDDLRNIRDLPEFRRIVAKHHR